MARFSLHVKAVADVSYFCLLSEGKRDEAKIGMLHMLHDRIELIVTLIFP